MNLDESAKMAAGIISAIFLCIAGWFGLDKQKKSVDQAKIDADGKIAQAKFDAEAKSNIARIEAESRQEEADIRKIEADARRHEAEVHEKQRLIDRIDNLESNINKKDNTIWELQDKISLLSDERTSIKLDLVKAVTKCLSCTRCLCTCAECLKCVQKKHEAGSAFYE